MKQNNSSKLRVKNYYYLIAGVLAILFSFTHAWNGQTAVLPIINGTIIDAATKTTMFYVWHIITTENFIFGVAFIIMAFYKDLSKVRFAAGMIAVIMISRWGVIFGSTLSQNINDLSSNLMDLIVIVFYAGLILLGTRVKNKIPK
ncbi:MAG: hypothetical protein WCR42_05725 [bacterium]